MAKEERTPIHRDALSWVGLVVLVGGGLYAAAHGRAMVAWWGALLGGLCLGIILCSWADHAGGR